MQVELAHLQAWVKKSGARIAIIFEGRDAAGKGGVIRRITERVSPRVFRVVALPAPTDREKSQIYMQRYIPHLPAAGEIVIFDRSWYNRPGVERVMGFCSEKKARRFLDLAPRFEAAIIESGITLLKYFLDVSEEEQEKRFRQRIDDPLRQWKLSPMDVESYRRWWDYTNAYNEMISMTDTRYAPWWIVPSNDKKRARINCISHILSSIPYERVAFEEPESGQTPEAPRRLRGRYHRQKRGAGRILAEHVRNPTKSASRRAQCPQFGGTENGQRQKYRSERNRRRSASELRMLLLEEQMAEAKKREGHVKREQDKLSKFTEDFLRNQVTEDEIAMVRRLVMNAVKDGKLEALVYSFPSNLCTDSGRAINSGDPQWTETLQGKAREFYNRYVEFGRPQGYKLKAMIINFPGGMPGDVGFFLNWAPEAK